MPWIFINIIIRVTKMLLIQVVIPISKSRRYTRSLKKKQIDMQPPVTRSQDQADKVQKSRLSYFRSNDEIKVYISKIIKELNYEK